MNWGTELATTHQRYGDRIGIVDAEGPHRIADVLDVAAGIARRLAARGLGPGAVVATIFHNSALAASASYAVSLAGAAEVPVNPLLSPHEIAHALACTGAGLVLMDGADELPADLGVPCEDVRGIGAYPFVPEGWPDVDPDAPSRIVFTSGTTGPAKGAIHTHRGRWTGTLMLRASLPVAPGRESRVLLITPFSHGSSLLTFAYLAQGASVHLLRGVAPAVVLPLLASGEITEAFAPPTVLAKLLDAWARPEYRDLVPKLRTILTGTAPLTPLLYRGAVARFGEIVRVTYGKSEIFNPITVLDPPETAAAYAEAPGEGLCVGWPATGVQVEIRDEAGLRVPRGETGAIHLMSPHLSTGYITREGRRLRADGEFHDTGDIGFVDARGRLFLVARHADMMKSGGYKVSPDEVERALAPFLPETELVVLGIPSHYWGEIVTLVAQRPPEDWRARLGPALDAMTPYKRPRLFAAVEELPRNAIGKIARTQLRRHLMKTHDLVEAARPALVAKPGGDAT
ncbi:2-succinylbenzoate--CoA ligase [Methylobacterium crusticola]|uniref:2-succinylbenzoate--CoA ligase n=1 Tax=Methylobacterium crusticola TaxID=1697972 RepID=A0ABQ4R7F6_9HYPH|nr:AMP-binding protein [Methylobacterium crusticola]GJD52672.1 2-succinylbenzoate--CoA ligase [Methylobacterium crusticola]